MTQFLAPIYGFRWGLKDQANSTISLVVVVGIMSKSLEITKNLEIT